MPLIERLASFLQIRPGEARLVALVSTLFALIEAGRGIGGNSVDALFFLRFGVEFLPYMFMLLGATNFVVSLSYAVGLGRFDKRRFFVTMLAALAVVLLVERASILLDTPALYPVLWITVNIISSVLGILTWNIAGEVCDARQAKRLFSIFVSAGILGGVAGNFVTGPIAKVLGTENLLILYAVLMLAGAWLTAAIIRQFFPRAPKHSPAVSFIAEIRAGYDFVRGSSMFKIMAVGSVLFSILYFSISFPFSKAVSAAFPGEADVAGFLGTFSGIATAITFGASLFVANRLYARIGVVNAVLLLPITYLIGFVLFALNFSLTSAIIARMSQLVILGGIAGTAYNTLFNIVPSDRRGQVLSFDSGVPSQVGVALSGVLLILGERVLTPTQIFIMGMAVALACGFLVWRMRRAYGTALVEALRAGRFEVFSAGARAFAGFRGDANAIRVAVDALRDPKPSTRRLAIEMLARMNAAPAAPDLVKALSDPDAEVRAAAIRALGDLDARDDVNAVMPMLGDADAIVRATALRVLPDLDPPITPTLLTTLEAMLRDADLNVRAQATVTLARFSAINRALPMLNAMLRDANPDTRACALDALREIGAGFDLAPVMNALHDESALVRRAACRTLSEIGVEASAGPPEGSTALDGMVDALADRLGDPDSTVRGAAAGALRIFGAKAASRVLTVLRAEDAHAQDAALDGLVPNDPNLLAPLSDYAHDEITRVWQWREMVAAIPPAGRVTKLLCETLTARCGLSEQRLIKTVGLLGNPEAMELVGRGLKSRNAESRAAAVETLETLGHKQIAKQIILLLDDAPPASKPGQADAVVRQLLASKDSWLRALAAGSVAELNLPELVADLHALNGDPDPLVRQAARDALNQLPEGEPMETLKTVSTMERILLLRDVPLFADLSPDDLKQIADIAREQWYADGALICRDGEEGRELYVLASGQVRVVKESGGAEKLLATRRMGDFIGEMAIVESAPRSATVRADGEVRTLVIDGEAFKAILRDRPEVSLAVLRAQSRRIRELSQRTSAAQV